MTNLKYYRITSSLTQAQVAKKLGITQATYSKIEAGQVEPKLSYLIQLAKLYKVKVDALI